MRTISELRRELRAAEQRSEYTYELRRAILSAAPPVIVNVLPLPVWPYAKIVPLYPSSTESTTGRATVSNTVSCVVDMSRTRLKAKE